jgi:hypothetical protein
MIRGNQRKGGGEIRRFYNIYSVLGVEINNNLWYNVSENDA